MIRSVPLGPHGRPVDDVIADLLAIRDGDVRWAEGRTFSLVYDGGPTVHEVAERAHRAFLHDNTLNTLAFPSLGRIQSDVVGWTADLLHAPPGAAGFLTSGGTEWMPCAVLAARERGRQEHGITAPQMVVAASAHAAFHKSAHLFGVEAVTTRCSTTGPPTSTPSAGRARSCRGDTTRVVSPNESEPRRASFIRVRSNERCTMTGCSLAVRTLVSERFTSGTVAPSRPIP